jgi:dTDP-4-amino-4,6-dideoxygalactose transaminase
VATAVHYPLALTQQPAYEPFRRGPCPAAEAWAASCTTLPCFPELTDDEVATVIAALERA